MKKRILPLLTVLLLAVLMTVAVMADSTSAPSLAIVPAVTDTLEEGDTFDVYIVATPFEKIGNASPANYVYRVPEDEKAGKVPNNNNNNLTDMLFTVNWDMDSLEAYQVTTFEGTSVTATPQDAGNGYYYAALATSTSVALEPEVVGYGTGASNTGVLTINYGSTVAGGFLVGKVSSTPNGVVAKITFRVVAGAEGGANNITLDNSYKYAGTSYSATQTSVSVNVAAGCAHVNKTALTPDELAAAGLENSVATCIKEDVTWYYCSDCSQNIKVSTGVLLPHSYTIEKYVIGSEPTCTEGGLKAMYCSVDPDCTAHDAATETAVGELGHDFAGDAQHIYAPNTCTDDGYDFYVCSRCHQVSKDGDSVLRITYDGSVFVSLDTRKEVDMPAEFVTEATGHDWVFDRSEGEYSYYVCANECGIAEQEIAIADTVRYVSTNGGGDGSSAESTVTLAQAFDAFKDMPAVVDCTIYLVGKVELAHRPYSSSNTAVKNFEEAPHEATVTITTAPGASKGELHFPFATASMYYLYGPTVFDNIKISSSEIGTEKGSSASITIFARGFELTMTENFETISNGNGIKYSKLDGSFSLATPMTMNIPDCKLYLVGGFYPGGGYEGLETNPYSYETNMNIFGGTYWVVAGTSRNENLTAKNSVINISVGGNARIGQLLPLSTATGNSFDGTVVNMHYYDGYEGVLVYRANNAKATGEYTVNHFFHEGTGDMKIGDFMMGIKSNHGRNVNVYYYEFDEGAVAMARAVYEKGRANATNYDYYNNVGWQDTMTFTEWCAELGGGHTFVDGNCSFCGVKYCEAYADHRFDLLNTTGELEFVCTICGATGSYAGENTGVIYVSDNGKGNGGFSADYPINDFENAMKLAAAYDGDATIYIVDSITIKSNYTGQTTHTVFVEPKHTNHITISGYKTSALFKFGAVDGGRILYNLNGDTTFENIEFAEWYSNNVAYSFNYIIANHNHLTIGENVSSSYERHLGGGNFHNGKLVVLGGCYHANYTLAPANAKNCTKTDAHVTFYSGNFYNVIGGSAGIACGLARGTIQFDFFGDVVIQDYFAAGSFQKPAGDIILNFNGGNVATAAMFSISGYNGADNLFHSADVKDVTIKIYSGSVSSNNFQASQEATSLRPIGATYTGETVDGVTTYDITAHLDSLTVCYDPANGSARDTYNHIMNAAATASKTVAVKIIGETFCDVNANGVHAKGKTIEEVPSTCAKQGYGVYVCTACNKQYTDALDVVAHTFGTAEVATAANCINPEIMKEVCIDCGFIQYSLGDEAATGVHEYEDGVCVYCSQSLQDVCEHVWDDGVAISTGCGTGVQYTCTNGCGKTRVEVTSASHNYGKYTITVEPTETEAGVKTRTCKSCGKVDTALIYADGSAVNNEAIAVDANGALADVEIATSKLTKAEKAAIDALLQETAYGSEVKVSYNVDGSVANVTYSIPLPAEYEGMTNLQVVVKDDEGVLHTVQFTVEKGYIVFTF